MFTIGTMVEMENLITGVAHIGIRVFDLDRARRFYEDLGFEFIVGPVGPEPVAILTHPSGTIINLILNASSGETPNILMDVEDKHPGYTHVALAVRDIKEVEDTLNQKGISITEGPIKFPGGTSLFVRDPDRNVIEFHEEDT